MTIEILDPTFGDSTPAFQLAERPASLAGMTIGIVSNGKHGTRPFFDAIERELIEVSGAAAVIRTTKTNYSAPADREIMDQASQWNALISGIGD